MAELYFEYDGNKYPVPFTSPEHLDEVKGFSFRPHDIMVASYPKCGKFNCPFLHCNRGSHWLEFHQYDLIIDREAREIIRLAASVHLSVLHHRL